MGVAVAHLEPRTAVRRRQLLQRLLIVVVTALLAGCETATVTPTPGSPGPASPGASETAIETIGPEGSGGPSRSANPGGQPAVAALPQPTLAEPFEIGLALYDPANAATGVVSLLSLMGVEVTAADGTVILAGADNGAGQLHLSESEAFGLIEMTQADLETEGPLPLSVADLHAALAPSLPADYTAAEFAAAYDRAYAEDPEALVAQVMLGQPIAPETELLRIQMWLLLVDGFAPPASTAALASVVTAAVRPRLGAARPYQPPSTPQIAGMSAAHWSELLLALPTLPFRVSFQVHASGAAHEGHGRLGDPVDFEATIDTPQPLVASDGTTILIHSGQSAGISFMWDSRDIGLLAAHGTLNGNIRTPVTIGATGVTRIRYTPRREDADGRGEVVSELGDLHASVDQFELVSRAYSLGGATATARGLIRGRRIATGTPLHIAWHEPHYIAFGILNVYEFQAGVAGGPDLLSIFRKGYDLSVGTLYRRSDGTYRGSVKVTQYSHAVGEAFLGLAGMGRCNDTLTSEQLLTVTGQVDGGELHLRFYPGGQPDVVQAENLDDDLQPLGPEQFPLCQPVIPFAGATGFGAGVYIPINDTRWSNPDAGYAVDYPGAGQLVRGTDDTLVGVHPEVCSVFYTTVYRSDPNQQPAPSPPPTMPEPEAGVCDQMTPP